MGKLYVNEASNERIISSRAGGEAAPGKRIELEDEEVAALTKAGYALTPVAAPTPKKPARDQKPSKPAGGGAGGEKPAGDQKP